MTGCFSTFQILKKIPSKTEEGHEFHSTGEQSAEYSAIVL